jgi:undecaprenyl-diphosphatase
MQHPASGDRLGVAFRKLGSADASVCAYFNRMGRTTVIQVFFRVVSRLGDGVFWYVLMAVLPVIAGGGGLHASVHMLLTSALALPVYRTTKEQLGRERPYILYGDRIACNMAPLDRYSFPSGHTLHAVSFSVIACAYFPTLVWALLPFTVLVAVSRMILGLHYPSDVLAGAAIGGVVASLSLDVAGLMAA